MNEDLNIEVKRVYHFDSSGKLKAFVDIAINDALLIKGLKVLEGKNGLFVAMPQEKAKDNKWYDSVKCLTVEFKLEIDKAVLAAYNEG